MRGATAGGVPLAYRPLQVCDPLPDKLDETQADSYNATAAFARMRR